MIWNRDEHYIPVPPYSVKWWRHALDLPGSAGPFMESHPALQTMISLGWSMQHEPKWAYYYIIDGVSTVIAGYSQITGPLQIAVPPKALRPTRWTDPEVAEEYDRWVEFNTRIADRLALAHYEEES